MSDQKGNSVSELKKFLSVPGREVAMAEFKEFWDSLTDEEKDEFRQTELPKE